VKSQPETSFAAVILHKPEAPASELWVTFGALAGASGLYHET